VSRIYSEDDVSWASIEKYIPYSKIEWRMSKNGIPKYNFFYEDGKKININDYIKENI
jgi:hypothetical protein